METNFDHNKLLKKIAKDKLKPYGINQIGNSRTFLYDGDWYVIIVEFQPSSRGKGSYLNIGIDLNFYPREYLAFSYGYREKEFQASEDEKHFVEIVNNYCDHVIEKTQKLKDEFSSISKAIDIIKSKYLNDSWSPFDLGVLYGLTGNPKEAEFFLTKLKNEVCTKDYEFERQKLAIELLSFITNKDAFLLKSKSLIEQSRRLKKLPALSISI